MKYTVGICGYILFGLGLLWYVQYFFVTKKNIKFAFFIMPKNICQYFFLDHGNYPSSKRATYLSYTYQKLFHSQ